MVIVCMGALQCCAKKKEDHAVNIEEARVSNDLFRKAQFVQVNYVEGGSLKRFFFVWGGQLKTHTHTCRIIETFF